MGIYASAQTANQAANSPATGWPGIIGTVRAGETLTATTDHIGDEDGLTGAVFNYQWVRSGTDIEEETTSTYTMTAADGGKAIKVRVTFTDDAGNEESLASDAVLSSPPPPPPPPPAAAAAAAAPAPPPPPPTPAVRDKPESHNGQPEARSAPAVGQPGGFGDVPDGAYYSVPVSALAERGLFDDTGCEAGFCPGEPIDRKTMAVWIVRLLDGENPATVSETSFDDVDASSFYGPFIERMAELEVTSGCGDGSRFCPDRSVTRAETAVFLSRAFDLGEGPDPGFSDVPADAWYADSVARLAASRITIGCGDGTEFCPSRATTRAQMATFLARALGLVETPGSTPPAT